MPSVTLPMVLFIKKSFINILLINRTLRFFILLILSLAAVTNVNAQRFRLTLQTDGTPEASIYPSGTIRVHSGQRLEINVTNIPDGYNFDKWTVEEGLATIDDAFALTTYVTLTLFNAVVQANFIPSAPTSPTAELSGSASICSGEFADLTVTLTGNAPWEVVYTDGNENITLSGITSSPHTFSVSPEATKTYTLISVKDADDNPGEVSGRATVTVSPLTVGGYVTGEKSEILLAESTGTLVLYGHTGGVVRWERQVNGGSWTEIDNTTTTHSETPSTTGIYRFRAVVQSGVCDIEYSAPFEIEVANSPPSAHDVGIIGRMEVGFVLTATYEYFDPEGDPEGDTEIIWYSSDDDSGTNEQEIHRGEEYTLLLDDENKYIRIIVIPFASEGALEGSPVPSSYYGPVENTLPTVSLRGPADFCQGSVAELVFELTGRAPWTVFYTDGTDEYSFTANASPFVLDISVGGAYRVVRVIDAEGLEGTELGEELVISSVPTIFIDDWYTEIFDNGASGWMSATPSPGMVNSWVFGLPDGDIFTSASEGANIWYTDITDLNIAEQSFVTSPCFDFSELERPMIAIDLWREFGKDNDGAVLQYSINNDHNWKNAGMAGQGINWYNSSQIAGMPGGQQTGWTAPGQPDENGWTDSRHDLDIIAGQEFIRFRIAYGSDGSGQSQGGLAFDNIRIGDRTRLVLLEHFTNANDENSIAANKIVNDVAESKKHDVAYISYHTAFPSSDPINSQNPADPAARALYYGISTVPFSVMDGGLSGEGRYNYSPARFNENDLLARALVEPYFNIDISQDQVNSDLSIEVEVSSVFTIGPLDLTLHVAILETEIPASVIGQGGDVVYRNVVRRLLPDAGGTLLPVNWGGGQAESYSFSWAIENVFDSENLALVAFIQDENTQEIYQVGTSSEFGLPTFIELPERSENRPAMVFYPNPASDYLFIEFPESLAGDYILEVFNLSGNMVYTDMLRGGRSNYEFNTKDLARGVYLFRIRNNYGILGTARINIVK